ncbi:MAG: TlpA disulfide reductase family protein [Balneolaceae bacterium]
MTRHAGLMLLYFLISCNPESAVDSTVRIDGEISGREITALHVEQKPLHYKYSDKIVHPADMSDNGKFTITLPLAEEELVTLSLDGTDYPLMIFPGMHLTLSIDGNSFPRNVAAGGYDLDWNERYQQYLNEVSPIEKEIASEMDAFRRAEENRILGLYEKKVRLAEDYFKGTPLSPVYFASVGDYLNHVLRNISYQQSETSSFDAESAREDALDYARRHDFFSLESQKAQRAGIRDFAHYYSMSYNVADSLRSMHGGRLSEQDVRRLGYERLNRYRERVARQAAGEEARAYAEMHLVAERLGEMPLDISEESLENYLETYADYEEYTRFLLEFHDQIAGVRPGQPAAAFTLPDQHGNRVSMSDYDGRYVLLDFWASWCIPCLEEFPSMKRIYRNTSRDRFEIVGISLDEDSLSWRKSIEKFNNPWIQLYGGDGFQQETFRTYRGGGIPFYILVNPDGRIERFNDIRATYNLESVLDSLLDESFRE